ncbi:family 16 glycoside hydrolase [Cadophora sp. MPI-SDFR-AT-0126]|nr:family 16 glycoside hydrolase [Leotiomycetes sp. MPI-SDFR-AT-0126]
MPSDLNKKIRERLALSRRIESSGIETMPCSLCERTGKTCLVPLRAHRPAARSALVLGRKPDPFRVPLRANGRYIVDASDKRVKLASVNWHGASDLLFVPGGLDVQHRSKIASVIRHLGFNSTTPMIPAKFLLANKALFGLRALDIYVAVVNSLTEAGIAVIINNHITQATWCCCANLCDTAWYNNYLGAFCRVRQTEDHWVDHWESLMASFVDNPLVIGADLRNKPRGLWGTMPWAKWVTAAERAGNILLALRDDWLIFIEGVSSSNDLSGVRDRPMFLDFDGRVVYSAHVYSWSGWGSLDGMYAKRPFDSFAKSMMDNWAYLLEENIAPVWVGEFGGPHLPNTGDLHYWNNLLKFLKMVDADFGYWALNPRKPANNESESYGLVEDDWQTPILDYRLRDMIELGRQ